MPIKFIRVPRERELTGICYQESSEATVRLTQTFVDKHFRGRRPSEIILVAWVDPPAKRAQ